MPLEITPDLLLRAYASGLFPMAESADDPALYWVDPEVRGVFPLDGIQVSRSLRKAVRSDRFTVCLDQDFQAVIEGCAAAGPGRGSTWINSTIRALYAELFDLGFVHTVEAYAAGELAGGLYGVALGGAFFGESMFHRQTDASKVCLVHLAAHLVRGGYQMLDAQFVTPHLATLGAIEMPRGRYRRTLAKAIAVRASLAGSTPLSGEESLAILADAAARKHLAGSYLPAGSLPPKSDG
jgi:leucyl/phenylalanyl-tRNA--protein transferase